MCPSIVLANPTHELIVYCSLLFKFELFSAMILLYSLSKKPTSDRQTHHNSLLCFFPVACSIVLLHMRGCFNLSEMTKPAKKRHCNEAQRTVATHREAAHERRRRELELEPRVCVRQLRLPSRHRPAESAGPSVDGRGAPGCCEGLRGVASCLGC